MEYNATSLALEYLPSDSRSVAVEELIHFGEFVDFPALVCDN